MQPNPVFCRMDSMIYYGLGSTQIGQIKRADIISVVPRQIRSHPPWCFALSDGNTTFSSGLYGVEEKRILFRFESLRRKLKA